MRDELALARGSDPDPALPVPSATCPLSSLLAVLVLLQHKLSVSWCYAAHSLASWPDTSHAECLLSMMRSCTGANALGWNIEGLWAEDALKMLSL